MDGLSTVFEKYEVPFGLINKLLDLIEYKLHFIVDDSASMKNNSDALFTQASDFMRRKCDPEGKKARSQNACMTRWQEAEDRLHIMIDMLAYIPTNTITITFLNRKDTLVLDHKKKITERICKASA